MSEMQGDSVRTADQIEADLERTRLEMTATVDQLVAQLQPANLAAMAKEDVARRFSVAKVQAFATVDAARDGDSDAIRKVGIAAAGALGLLAFVVWRWRR